MLGRRMFAISRRDLGVMMIIGVLIAFYQAAYFASILYAGVTISTLITCCAAPILVALVAVLFKQEPLTFRLIAVLGFALVGTVLLSAPSSVGVVHDDLWLGIALAVLSGFGYGCVIILGRWLSGDYHPLQVTTISFATGTLALIVISLISGVTATHTVQGGLLLIYLGVVPTALAYWLFLAGMRTVTATSASIIMLVDPLTAAVLAWILFGEQLRTAGFVGGLFLLISLAVLSWGRSSRKPVIEPVAA